jgi:hypothetical protein
MFTDVICQSLIIRLFGTSSHHSEIFMMFVKSTLFHPFRSFSIVSMRNSMSEANFASCWPSVHSYNWMMISELYQLGNISSSRNYFHFKPTQGAPKVMKQRRKQTNSSCPLHFDANRKKIYTQ